MFTNGFGEVLATAMTVNPALANIPETASILDTSNYTFQAVAFGADEQSYTSHAHLISLNASIHSYVLLDPYVPPFISAVSGYQLGFMRMLNVASNPLGESLSLSSYVVSAVHKYTSATYNSLPSPPKVTDTRLEPGSTLARNVLTTLPVTIQNPAALPDVGHHPNSILHPDLSSVWNVIGAYPPADGVNNFDFVSVEDAPPEANILVNFAMYNGPAEADALVVVGSASSYFNANGLLDVDGYLTIAPSGAISDSVSPKPYVDGALILSSTSLFNPAQGGLAVDMNIVTGDLVGLAAFGGVNHVGLYCLDMEDMLASGLLPPYAWDALNNIRKYKLVNKVTSTVNLLQHRDNESGSGLYFLNEATDGIRITIGLNFN